MAQSNENPQQKYAQQNKKTICKAKTNLNSAYKWDENERLQFKFVNKLMNFAWTTNILDD